MILADAELRELRLHYPINEVWYTLWGHYYFSLIDLLLDFGDLAL